MFMTIVQPLKLFILGDVFYYGISHPKNLQRKITLFVVFMFPFQFLLKIVFDCSWIFLDLNLFNEDYFVKYFILEITVQPI